MREEGIMSDKVYKTIAEIDAELEKAFAEAEKEVVETTDQTEKPTVQENTDDNTEEVEAVEEAESVKEQPKEAPKQETKPKPETTKEDKQDYAFKQLREEASSAKKQLQTYEESISEMDTLAQSQGFKNHTEFLAAWKERQIEEEAKSKNIDPKVLKELNDTKNRLSKIEKEKAEAVKESQLTKINVVIDGFASKYKLDENAITQILAKMGADKVTIESLVSTPIETLEKMLTGYAQDIIVEKKVQERLASLEANGNSPAPEKHKNTTSAKKAEPFSKEALESEMEAFKKANYPWLK
jgi:hypothetical protein